MKDRIFEVIKISGDARINKGRGTTIRTIKRVFNKCVISSWPPFM
jgi:hypothetical protein